MTGEWLTVKWIVVALFALFVLCMLTAFARLDGKSQKRAGRISFFMFMTYWLAHAVRDIFESVVTMRAFYVVVGFGLIGTIVALVSLVVGKDEKGLAES